MSGEFTITLNRSEYVAAYWFYLRKRWLWRRMILSYSALVLVYAGLLVALESWDWGFYPTRLPVHLRDGALYSLVIAVVIIGISMVNLPRRVGRLFTQLRIDDRETRFEYDATGLRTANRDVTTNYAWNRFQSWIENDRLILLVMGDMTFVAVPKPQIFTSAVDQFRTAIIAAGIPQR
ncbi:MAG TPA: YcxB family protein [Novosphingobium sp.]|nr:YcxB family protein [Novosphingobium sp.]